MSNVSFFKSGGRRAVTRAKLESAINEAVSDGISPIDTLSHAEKIKAIFDAEENEKWEAQIRYSSGKKRVVLRRRKLPLKR